jgi:predicted O-methyltransferase YrrM
MTELGGAAITEGLYEYIRRVLPEGSTILELGSGFGTGSLGAYYHMHSVEHDEKYLYLYDSNYIRVPLKEHKAVQNHEGTLWYDADILRPQLQKLNNNYDLLLIDGPPVSRAGFVKYFDMFNPKAIMVFDDVNRRRDNRVMLSIASKLQLPFVTYGAGTEKLFGVINDPCTR